MAQVDLTSDNNESVLASLHEYRGVCDFCQEKCDPETQDLNLVCCSYAKCPTPGVFHQCCVDEYLKKRKLGKNAKIGFPCLRGYSNKSAYFQEPCKGRVFRLHHVKARQENSKKRQKAKMPDNFVPGPAKRDKKEKGADKAENVKAPNPPAAAKPKQSFVNIFEAANRQPAKRAAPPPTPRPPPGMDKGAMDAIRRQVETMRAAKKNGSAAPKKPPTRQDQLLSQQAQELQRASSDASSTSGWAAAAQSEGPAEEDPADSDDDPDSEWVTVVGRKKGKAPAKAPTRAPAVAQQPPAGMSKKQAKRQAYLERARAAQQAKPKPAPKPEAKGPAAVPSPPPLFNAWAKPEQEQQQAPTPWPPAPVAPPRTPPPRRPSPATPPAARELRPWSENLKTVIKEYKIRQATKQLLELGFPDWLSVTAVRACGTDVDRCCEWLASGQSPVEPSIDISQELARISKWVYIGNLSQDVVEIALISCSGDVNATETVLKSNFEHFAEHGSEAFAPHPPPAPSASSPAQNSWSDDLFPLHWGDADGAKTQTVAQPPQEAKKEQMAPAPKQAKPAGNAKAANMPPKPESPAFEIPEAVLKAANECFITDLSRYNELLGISDEDESDEEWTDEEEEEDAPEEIENRDPASLWNEYLKEADSQSSKQEEVVAPPTPPPREGRTVQHNVPNGSKPDANPADLLAAYGLLPSAPKSAPRPYMPARKYEPPPEEDQDLLVSRLMNQLLV